MIHILQAYTRSNPLRQWSQNTYLPFTTRMGRQRTYFLNPQGYHGEIHMVHVDDILPWYYAGALVCCGCVIFYIVLIHILYGLVSVFRHLKEPYKMSMALGFSLPAHLCAVTNITEILLNVTLSYQFNQRTNHYVNLINSGAASPVTCKISIYM